MRRSRDVPVDLRQQEFRRLERTLTSGLTVSTTSATSARMALVRRSGTAPELAVRRVARAIGLRFTIRNSDLPGSPDLANRSRRRAVFVHGCYWHRHSKCSRATMPKQNFEFWRRKFKRNMERDASAVKALKALGFRVAVIWECEAGVDKRIGRALAKLIRSRTTATCGQRYGA
jgi:DNA mismatch endonuclease, patch repair protein